MIKPLVPCPSCNRHVRSSEAACPFCRAELPSDLAARAIPSATQRLSRAAAFVFTASLAAGTVAVAGCSGSESNSSAAGAGGGSTSGGGSMTTSSTSGGMGGSGGVGGMPAGTGGAGGGGPIDGGGGNMALYGGPPPDAGHSTGASMDDGGIQPLYGASPSI